MSGGDLPRELRTGADVPYTAPGDVLDFAEGDAPAGIEALTTYQQAIDAGFSPAEFAATARAADSYRPSMLSMLDSIAGAKLTAADAVDAKIKRMLPADYRILKGVRNPVSGQTVIDELSVMLDMGLTARHWEDATGLKLPPGTSADLRQKPRYQLNDGAAQSLNYR